MLSLFRKQGQWVDIDGGASAGGVSIFVARFHQGGVQLDFAASKDISIHRREVQMRKEREALAEQTAEVREP